MRQGRRQIIMGWAAAAILLLVAACTDRLDIGGSPNLVKGEAQALTLTIQPQIQASEARTRQAGSNKPGISTGSNINTLIYAIYQSDKGKNDFHLVDTVRVEEKDSTKIPSGSKVEGVLPGMGQTVVPYPDAEHPLQLYLTIWSDKDYKVAFWAENSERAYAYDTRDLKNVKVNYYAKDNVELNNDELRDAFSGVLLIKGDSVKPGAKATVHLYRPFAQINVGTTGWDYEGSAILKPSPVGYTHSQIELKGKVAQYYNVLDDKVLSEDAQGNSTLLDGLTFSYNRLPAFLNLTEEQWDNLAYTTTDNEEFLKVNRDENAAIAPYISWAKYDNLRKTDTEAFNKGYPYTETYKYLSMCYVLVPESSGDGGSVLDEVKFTAKGKSLEDDEDDASGSDEEASSGNGEEDNSGATEEVPGEGSGDIPGNTTDEEIDVDFSVTQVPVQKRWRTNLLSNNFFIFTDEFTIDVVPDYCGDNNSELETVVEGREFYISFDVQSENCGTTDSTAPGVSTKYKSKGIVTCPIGFFSYGKLGDDDGKDANHPVDMGEHRHNHFDGTRLSGRSDMGTYNGVTFNSGLRIQKSTIVEFKTTSTATITIVKSVASNDFDFSIYRGEEGEEEIKASTYVQSKSSSDKDIKLYVLTGQKANKFKIGYDKDYLDSTDNNNEVTILYISVKYDDATENDGTDYTEDENGNFHDHDYYDKEEGDAGTTGGDDGGDENGGSSSSGDVPGAGTGSDENSGND